MPMHIVVYLFALVFLGAMPALGQDVSKARCAAVAYIPQGKFGISANRLSCDDARANAIGYCEQASPFQHRELCREMPVVAIDAWFFVGLCSRNESQGIFVVTDPSLDGLAVKAKIVAQRLGFAATECKPSPIFHSSGKVLTR
jgi:hypothetical protein